MEALENLKSKINIAKGSTTLVQEDLFCLSKSITSAANDKVGVRARESLDKLKKDFNSGSSSYYASADTIAAFLADGYGAVDNASVESERLYQKAEALMGGI